MKGILKKTTVTQKVVLTVWAGPQRNCVEQHNSLLVYPSSAGTRRWHRILIWVRLPSNLQVNSHKKFL